MTVLLAPGAGAQSKFKTLHTFRAVAGGHSPAGDLIFDQSGNLYGTTGLDGVMNSGTVYKLTPNQDGSWTESVLYSFCSLAKCADGEVALAGLIFDGAGNLYGTTSAGGANGGGTVFKLSPSSGGSWTESVLYSFCSLNNCVDGEYPQSSLVFDPTGNLYGTTASGGAGSACDIFDGCGTVFKVTPSSGGSWAESVLHIFCSLAACADGQPGQDSLAGVIFDGAGNLYGTTSEGGNLNQCGGSGCGVVFELTPKADGSWKEEVLYGFTGGRDGAAPEASLLFDGSGNLYGTAHSGGNSPQCDPGSGCGVAFELTPDSQGSWKEKVLHSFAGVDGGIPFASLVFDKAGNLYGTTAVGGDLRLCRGPFSGCGVVFELTPNSKGGWKETVLHRFLDHPGADPKAGVILDAAGNVYGTTLGDRTTTFGSVFEITP
jgi:uncharacterized repeat protein (TIGR03803 family)